MAILVRVPILKGNIFGGDPEKPRPSFGQSPSEQATQTEPAGVIFVVTRLGFQGQVKSLCRRRAEQTMGVVHGPQQGFLLIIAAQLAEGTLCEELLVKFLPVLETRWTHAFRRLNAFACVLRVGDNERTIFASQKACGMKGLQFF